MSKSPHRFRGNAQECWTTLLFGEVLRAIDLPVLVRDEPLVKLPKTGHWESGLAKLRPSLDDALGSTAFAVAWRWACAEADANAWPGLVKVAEKATERLVTPGAIEELARVDGGVVIDSRVVPGGRSWIAQLPGGPATLSVSDGAAADWSNVDRLGDVLAAWLDVPWSIQAGKQGDL